MNSDSNQPISEPLDDFLLSKSKGGEDSGNYRRNLERCVEDFLEWVEQKKGYVPTFEEIDVQIFRAYSRDMATRDLAPGTVRTYYSHVAAYFGWCVREGLLASNYANRSVAKEPLPESDERRSGDQQAWSDEHRALITRFVNKKASEAVEKEGYGAVKEFRDRVVVYMLCYTGVRGGEVFADTKDDRRNGLRWGDVSLEDQKFTVYAKKQEWSDRAITDQVVGPLERYEQILQPGSDDWPVFPTFHSPKLYSVLREGLEEERGWNDSKIESFVEDITGKVEVLDAYRVHGLSPPSINTDGARRIMKRLCEEAGIETDDKHGYLAPHGGRRGAGEVMVRQRGFTEASRLLDNTEEMVREAYSHIDAKEMARDAGDAFDEHDGK